MGCRSSQPEEGDNELDKKHPDNIVMKGEAWESLTERKRGCTDFLCVLLIIVAWIVMTMVGFAACGVFVSEEIPKGDPMRLTHSTDYTGNICGYGKGVVDKPYAYYLATGSVVCVNSCPSALDYKKVVCKYDIQNQMSPLFANFGANVVSVNSLGEMKNAIISGNCLFYIKSSEEFNRCIPKISTSEINSLYQTLNLTMNSIPAVETGASWFRSFMGDIVNQAGIIFGFGIGVSAFLAFAYIYILRIPGFLTITIWTLLVSIFVLLIVGSWLLWGLANSWKASGMHQAYQVTTMYVFAYTGMAVTLLYLCLMVILGPRINLAIEIIKMAGRALTALPFLLLLPVFQVVALTVFMVPWVFYVIYLAASGTPVVHTQSYTYSPLMPPTSFSVTTFEYSENTKYAFIYMIFIMFWTSEFLVACGQIIIALCFSAFYFTRDKKEIGLFTFVWALKTTFFCHLGTAAFGSCIIAVIKTIRAIVAYIQRKAAKSQNKIVLYIMCVVQCCLWCLEKFMKFVNKNAYIQTAIHGYSFLKGARVAFFLLLRNILRVSAVSIISDFVLLMGKLFVSLLTVFIAYLLLAYQVSANEIYGLIPQLVLIGIMSYFVSSIFCEIYGMGIQTTLFCYIADEEMFPPDKRFADPSVKSSIATTQQAAVASNQVKVHPDNNKNDDKGETLL